MPDSDRSCQRCGSAELRVFALGRTEGQTTTIGLLLGGEMGFSGEPKHWPLNAAMCVACGHVELVVADPSGAARAADKVAAAIAARHPR